MKRVDLRMLPQIICVVALMLSQSACSANDGASDGVNNSADRFEVSVVGEGVVKSEPDRVVVNASLRLQGEQSYALLQEANKTITQVLKKLGDLGIDNKQIQAGQLRLNQRWRHHSGKQEAAGYEAVRSLSVALDNIDDYPKVIDQLFALGVNTLSGVEFTFSNQQALMDQAITLAGKEAARKAELLGKSMGGKSCRPLRVSQGGAAVPMPRMEMAAMRSHDAGAAYNPGEQAISASVSATFSCRY